MYGNTIVLFGIIIKLNKAEEIYTKIANLVLISITIEARKKVLKAKKNSLFVGSIDDMYSDSVDKRVTIPPIATLFDSLLYIFTIIDFPLLYAAYQISPQAFT